VWGVYTYRPPQKGVGPPVALVPMPGKRSLVSHFWTRVPRQLSHCRTLARSHGVERPMNTCAHRLAWHVLA
jgi:hypothetical protein